MHSLSRSRHGTLSNQLRMKKPKAYEDSWNSKTLSLQGRILVEDFQDAPNILH